ncbi:MAG: phage terminase large subunit family protein [Spirochaetaceae bacterium]|jgi:phage terminase large subunit GpA-like protein|nr:phage terminase large subunit family protein [Spirochaetaceae bacterium]
MQFASDAEFLRTLLFPCSPPAPDIAAWIEGRRILPASSPIPGPWRNSVTPYGVEIMNALSPNSGVKKIVIQKARKIGMTTILENVVLYYMFESPSDILYSTASETLAKDWADRKIGEAIRSIGMADRITANTSNAKKRRTGDTTNRKEYIGGALDIISHSAKTARRAMDKRCLFIDETDGVASSTATLEGGWLPILEAHTNSYGVLKKIALFSSPTTVDTSIISAEYEKSDCRQFFMPCPYCGEHITLELDLDLSKSYGLKAETQGGKIIDAFYVCPACSFPIRDYHKRIMFSENPIRQKDSNPAQKYEWKPTRISDDDGLRGYYLNSLNAPIEMLSFLDIAKEKQKAVTGTIDDRRSYLNIYCGLPSEETGERPEPALLLERRLLSGYHSGTVPAGVVFLTSSVDVQEGNKNDPENPARLEMEVCGHDRYERTWSITHKVFNGAIDNAYSGAWEHLFLFVKEHSRFILPNGTEIFPKLLFVDSGEAKHGLDSVVHTFCRRLSNTYAIKGFSMLKARVQKGERSDVPGAGDWQRYRITSSNESGNKLVGISTWYYKDKLYANLKIQRVNENEQCPGFCEFPVDYPAEYFNQLTAEDRLKDGSYKKNRARNEALDLRVYNLCAADVYIDMEIRKLKDNLRASGYKSEVINAAGRERIFDMLEKSIETKNQHID